MNYPALIAQAAELAQSGQYPELEIICRKIVKKKPKHFDALQLLGLAQSHTGQLSEAISNLKRARKINPQHASVRLNLANACLNNGLYEDAIKFSKEAIKRDASLFGAHIALGNALQTGKLYAQAEQSYQQALQLNPASAEAKDGLGECYKKQGRLSDALALFIEANDINPALSTVYIHLFQTLLLMQVTDDAIRVANTGLNRDVLSATEIYELRIGIARITWLTGDLDASQAAINAAQQIIGVNHNYANIVNLQAYDHCLRLLLQERKNHPQLYKGEPESAIFFVAESHALAASEVVVNYRGAPHRILSTLITGCKVWHLCNEYPNEYKASLESLFSAIPAQSVVVLGFGEIDCRVSEGIIKVCEDKKIDYQQSAEWLIKRYLELILSLAKTGQHSVILYGVPAANFDLLAPLDENQQKQLYEVIRLFNHHLKQSCQTHGLDYLDVYALTADDNGRSNQQYHIDAHHLHPRVFAALFESLPG